MEKVNYLKINLLNKSRVCFSHRPVCGGETRLWTDLRQLSWFLHLRLQQGIQTERRQEDLLKLVSHTHTHKHAQNTQTRVETVVTADSFWLCYKLCLNSCWDGFWPSSCSVLISAASWSWVWVCTMFLLLSFEFVKQYILYIPECPVQNPQLDTIRMCTAVLQEPLLKTLIQSRLALF